MIRSKGLPHYHVRLYLVDEPAALVSETVRPTQMDAVREARHLVAEHKAPGINSSLIPAADPDGLFFWTLYEGSLFDPRGGRVKPVAVVQVEGCRDQACRPEPYTGENPSQDAILVASNAVHPGR